MGRPRGTRIRGPRSQPHDGLRAHTSAAHSPQLGRTLSMASPRLAIHYLCAATQRFPIPTPRRKVGAADRGDAMRRSGRVDRCDYAGFMNRSRQEHDLLCPIVRLHFRLQPILVLSGIFNLSM
uniref:Uncharacterized protein n=1 Tax=Triticum urartu TaxID=4572 RepID=A0A8R7P884_TRIUA